MNEWMHSSLPIAVAGGLCSEALQPSGVKGSRSIWLALTRCLPVHSYLVCFYYVLGPGPHTGHMLSKTRPSPWFLVSNRGHRHQSDNRTDFLSKSHRKAFLLHTFATGSKWPICSFFMAEFWKFLMYSPYESFVGYVICKQSLPVCDVSFLSPYQSLL